MSDDSATRLYLMNSAAFLRGGNMAKAKRGLAAADKATRQRVAGEGGKVAGIKRKERAEESFWDEVRDL
jgi:hypothetical protein